MNSFFYNPVSLLLTDNTCEQLDIFVYLSEFNGIFRNYVGVIIYTKVADFDSIAYAIIQLLVGNSQMV